MKFTKIPVNTEFTHLHKLRKTNVRSHTHLHRTKGKKSIEVAKSIGVTQRHKFTKSSLKTKASQKCDFIRTFTLISRTIY